MTNDEKRTAMLSWLCIAAATARSNNRPGLEHLYNETLKDLSGGGEE